MTSIMTITCTQPLIWYHTSHHPRDCQSAAFISEETLPRIRSLSIFTSEKPVSSNLVHPLKEEEESINRTLVHWTENSFVPQSSNILTATSALINHINARDGRKNRQLPLVVIRSTKKHQFPSTTMTCRVYLAAVTVQSIPRTYEPTRWSPASGKIELR